MTETSELNRAAYNLLNAMVDNLPDEEIAEVLAWDGIHNPDDEDYDAIRDLLYNAVIG